MTNTKEPIAKAPEARVKRIPIGVRGRLNVTGKDPKFHYKIVKDDEGTGDRIEMYKEAGYVLSSGNEEVDNKRLADGSQASSVKTFNMGRGEKGYLMKIPMEYYLEDQAARQKQIDASEESLRSTGDYGGIKSISGPRGGNVDR